MQWVHKHFGGRIERHSTSSRSRASCWMWVAQGKLAGRILAAVYPFLIGKQGQARTLLAFLATPFRDPRRFELAARARRQKRQQHHYDRNAK